MFARSDVDAAERVLADQCGYNVPGNGTADSDQIDRVRLAAIRFSGGRLSRLHDAIELAAHDWRDLLVAAGFAEDTTAHAAWQPRAFDVHVVNHWFAGGSLPGVAFSPNQPVTVATGVEEFQLGSVISLEGLEPEPEYLVELGSGAELRVYQHRLARAD